MKEIKIADMTLRAYSTGHGNALTFNEKLEIAEKLDELRVDIIELGTIVNGKSDVIFLHTLAPLIGGSVLSCALGLGKEELSTTWEALEPARKKRLNVLAPVSTVQMEYQYHKKAPAVLGLIESQVRACRALCEDVELTLVDATRAEEGFLRDVIRMGRESGVGTITICDTAGKLFPSEYAGLCEKVYPELGGAVLSAEYPDTLHMASGCAFASVLSGANQIKTVLGGASGIDLQSFGQVYRVKGAELGLHCNLDLTKLESGAERIREVLEKKDRKEAVFEGASHPAKDQTDFQLSRTSTEEAVSDAVKAIGCELTKIELEEVYQAVRRISAKKSETIGPQELSEIVDAVVNQVMPTYVLKSFVTTSGNIIASSAHVILLCKGESVEGCSFGDGPIDAGFRAIEQITGKHYELDDFRINSVTEGASAMGSASVKLRNEGIIYQGKGLSTDIVGASIRAYIDALNKICAVQEKDK